MEKNQFLITKVFTVPYFDSLVEKKDVPDSFLKCISRYVKEDDELTYGKAISCIYEYMNSEYRNEYYYKNTIFNQLLIQKKTTVKEIRAHAFDYVTIATFKLIREINVLDLCSITHNSPFYADTDKVDYLINEQIMRAIERDLAKPMSRWDSELDYLPTQYISDFAKFCGYDGVRYYSTFDKDAYNIALFDSSACSCTYHRNFLVGDLEYKLSSV